MYRLFLDDVRDPIHVKQSWHNGLWVDFPFHYSWVIVRSYSEFIDKITKDGLPISIAFDHDLSVEDQGKTNYADFKELTGMHCAKWLVDYCLEKNLTLPEFYIHTLNPEGRKNLISYLQNFQRFQSENKKTS